VPVNREIYQTVNLAKQISAQVLIFIKKYTTIGASLNACQESILCFQAIAANPVISLVCSVLILRLSVKRAGMFQESITSSTRLRMYACRLVQTGYMASRRITPAFSVIQPALYASVRTLINATDAGQIQPQHQHNTIIFLIKLPYAR